MAPSLTSHHSIFFTLFVGPIPVTGAAFSFFFSIPKLTESSEKKKRKEKKEKNHTANPGKEKEKKKRKRTANANPKKKLNGQPRKRKKKVKRWSKVTAMSPLCVFNYNIAIEL